MKTTLLALCIFYIGFSEATEVDNFKIECVVSGSRVVYEYNKAIASDGFLVGPQIRSVDQPIYDLVDIGIKHDDDFGKYLEVHYDTPKSDFSINKGVSKMHQLRLYLKDRSMSVFTVTLNSERTKVLSILDRSTSSVIGQLSNCKATGI
jgi:hypothetical protein